MTTMDTGPTGLLKSVRYEDASDGRQPVIVPSINPPPRPASARPRDANNSSLKRPRTSPNPRASALSNEVKRDSGIAPSLSTATRDSYAESHLSSVAGTSAGAGVARETSLPTIVVQDDESPSAATTERRSFFSRRRPASRASQRSASSGQSPSPSTESGIQRIKSFRGIQAEIPSGSLSELIGLEDLASDKLGFSQRGSLLFGGQKMGDLIAAQGDGAAQSASMITPIARPVEVASKPHDSTSQETVLTVVAPPATPSVDESSSPSLVHSPVTPALPVLATPPDSPRKGLVTGRRKPSVHMLQAALHGGRVLSAEEISFSFKVRSMYEYGDENGALSAAPSRVATPSKDLQLQSATSLTDDVVVNRTRQASAGDNALQPPQPSIRVSYSKDAHEVAGGIEDWEDVEGQDVDRYGFIDKRRLASRGSAGSQAPGEGGIQRVATALRLEAEQPRRDRKVQRGLSNARSSRSLQPRSRDGTPSRAGGSVRSLGSTHSSRPPSSTIFRSQDRRTLASAANMLTLPPGLADIAEQADSGPSVSSLNRREWTRNEKWQKMARPVLSRSSSSASTTSVGGGMQFTFDTASPQLVNRVWKGIPNRWRATAWHSFLSTSASRRGKHVSDADLIAEYQRLQDASSADDVQIDVDVPRTINMHVMFRRRYRGGQRLLFRVLHAISLYCPDTGYVQGMASLAATLLCYFEEDMAFVMLVRLWQLRGLEQLFSPGFEGLRSALAEFEKEWLGPGDVAQILNEYNIDSTAYGTRWYLTLFNMSIPFPAQLRVWDVFMLLGDATPSSSKGAYGGADLDVLHATSAALIDAARDILLDSDFEVAMKVLTSFVPVKDEDLLMRVARAEWKMRKKRAS